MKEYKFSLTFSILFYFQESMAEHQDSFDPSNPRDFIDLYLREIFDSKGEQNPAFSGVFSMKSEIS